VSVRLVAVLEAPYFSPMPATYRLDLGNRVVWSRGWGVVTDEELQAHSRALGADPRFEPSFRQLQDLTDVGEPIVTPTGLRILAQLNPFGKNARRAVLVADDVTFGLARMHEMLRGASGDELQVFRDRAAAVEWLGLPPSWTPPAADPADPLFQSG
jgi:hypothetical protein